MKRFFESKIRRDRAGRFTHKPQAESGLSLTDPQPAETSWGVPIQGEGFTEPVKVGPEGQLASRMTVEGTARVWRTSDGLLHREGGPAVEHFDGRQQWFQQGELHREDGPAKTGAGENPSQWWYKHGDLHREDGPAFLGDGGRYQEWWFEGEQIGSDHWWKDGVPPTETIAKLQAQRKAQNRG